MPNQQSSPANRLGVRIDVQLDGSLVVGMADGSHAYSVLLTPGQIRALALDLWAVAEFIQPEAAPAVVASAAHPEGVVAWN